MWGTGVLPYEHKSINAQVLALLNKSLFVGVRGPDSKAVLKLGGFQKAEIIGDPGFLCPSIARKESKTIAINIGYARHQMYGREEDVAKEIKILVPLLNSAGYEVVLFPMWPDDVPILELVGYPVRKFNLSTSDLLSFLSSCYCTVGMKLHSSVLSAATFTPFISLAYRDKCLDFARSVGLDRWAIRTDAPRLAYKVMQLIEALPKYRDVIISRLQDYKYTYNKRHQEVSLLVNNLRAT
jgi:polysaccharide pyruvyl transferase WcaK-like protein